MTRRLNGGLIPALALLWTSVLADDAPGQLLHQRLDALQAGTPGSGYRLLAPLAVRQFYERRAFQPAWLGPDCAATVGILADAIREAEEHGLDSEAYHRDALAGAAACDLDLELHATDAWLSLAAHLHAGRLDPITIEPDWTAARPDIDLAERLQTALARGEILESLRSLAPDQLFYRALREALARYREYAARGGWTGVDSGPTLRPGDDGVRVHQLRARLALSGLLDPALAQSPAPFDEALSAAVKSFQRRANLEPDGIVGPLTLNQLNRRAADRIAQLRVNLERWRWLPEELGERHIRVNIADFTLEARAGGAVEREHRVIVGKQYRRTPVFSGRISYLVLNPWWETPRRLAVQDKLPLFSADPAAVTRLGFQILDSDGQSVEPADLDWANLSTGNFPYRLRQRPGPQNALGRVKLMFPNPHAVYLHDTPTQGLFARTRRDFSSGCIRVEDALGLSEWTLQETPGWNRARIDAAVASGAETTVSLAQRIPIHLLYLTAVPDGAGRVRFIDDLYDQDSAVLAALEVPPGNRSPSKDQAGISRTGRESCPDRFGQSAAKQWLF